MDWFVFACCVILPLVGGTQGCDVLLLEGIQTVDHYALTGVYNVSIGQTCSARLVYKQLGGDAYIYYKNTNWIIGARLCVDSGTLKIQDSTEHPSNATGQWEESGGQGWQPASGIEIRCYQGFKGCDKIELDGIQTADQYELTGIYQVSSSTYCSGRPVYVQLGNKFYLYFKFGHWVLAYQPCVAQVTFKVIDSAFYPEDVLGVWEQSVGGGWDRVGQVAVKCYTKFEGCRQIQISGVEVEEYQVMNTVYKLHASHVCTGRRVYVAQTPGYPLYVYYTNGHWIVGERLCADTGTLKVWDPAQYIENVFHLWEVSISDGWQEMDIVSAQCFYGFAGCPDIEVSGSQVTDLLSPVLAYGFYRHNETLFCEDNRPVYTQLGGGYYLYYFAGKWKIGEVPCEENAVLQVKEETDYPEDTTAIWHEKNGVLWMQNNDLVASCYLKYKGCEQIILENTQHHYDMVGVYATQDRYCNGRMVYQTIGGFMYMYYYSRFWVIGDKECNDTYLMRRQGSGQYPENEISDWEEYITEKWIETPEVTLQCFLKGFQGCHQLGLHNTLSNRNLEGTYTAMNNFPCNGRFVYLDQAEKHYLYNVAGNWVVGTERCSDTESSWLMRVQGGTFYPDNILDQWQERTQTDDGAIWHSSLAKLLCSEHHSVLLTGAKRHYEVVGGYDVTSDITCNDHVVLTQRDGEMYMFYQHGDNNHTGWFVGPERCSNSRILASVLSDVDDPAASSGTWREIVGIQWVDSVDMQLLVDPGFQGCAEITVTYSSKITNIYSVKGAMTFCNGRYIYRQTQGRFLYSTGTHWVIGSVRCSASQGISARIHDGSMYPEDTTNEWQVAFTTGVTLRVQCRTGCETLDIINTPSVGDIQTSGRYHILSTESSCFGRRSYKHIGEEEMYMYYVAFMPNKFSGWMVGDSLCLDHGYLRVWDPASYPDDIVHIWEARSGSDWSRVSTVQVVCAQESKNDTMANQTTFAITDMTSSMVSTTMMTPSGYAGQMPREMVIIITCVVVAGVVCLVLIIAILIYCLRRKKQQPPVAVEGHVNPLASIQDEKETNSNYDAVRMSDITAADNISDIKPNPD